MSDKPVTERSWSYKCLWFTVAVMLLTSLLRGCRMDRHESRIEALESRTPLTEK